MRSASWVGQPSAIATQYEPMAKITSASRKTFRLPDQIRQAAHERHRDCVCQQVSADDPGGIVQPRGRDFEIRDHTWQHCRNNGQIERPYEDRDTDQSNDERP